MSLITFIDTEIDPNSKRILDIGGVSANGSIFHSNSIPEFKLFLRGTQYLCGHNVIKHDVKYLRDVIYELAIHPTKIIDTLFLSALLFPNNPYHSLVKDDKLQTEELNNPVNDSIKAKNLFYDEVAAFKNLENTFQDILFGLLHQKNEFAAFFKFIEYDYKNINLEELIFKLFSTEVCSNCNLKGLISDSPIELAYSLALINATERYSITPPWVLKSFPDVERVMFLLRNNQCLTGCKYCNKALDVQGGLKRFFGFDSYRTFKGQPLQEKAVQRAVDNKSILAVFPTGGGKSITFQVPALMSGENVKGLTVIISPLQSLMKDQVDNLEKQGIIDAVTINGLLDPIERAKSFERVESGKASILYISPESLRSKSIERLVLGRNIVRFVIDEAHCFSSWGQDFRVDYLYIGDFIKSIQEKKNLSEAIPVSCFTATAKQNVIQDICEYFRDKLDLELEVFSSKASRTNLHYKVYPKENDEDKYNTIRNLIDEKNCPTIIYVSRTRKAYKLAERLTKDGYEAKPYHGKMDKQEKSENQDAFIRGDVQIMVATSAFGMGVDKKDVGMVIHFEISDSLENYVQEAGRAGRDELITADCYVLFNEEDLSKHFILLNQTKLSIKEIQQIWKAIKDITRFRSKASNSAIEIARMAGWDDNISEIETRVTTAIAALEDAGYLKRGQNMPQIFANSILSKNAQEAIEKIQASERFGIKQKQQATRIIKKLFSSKSRKENSDEVAESRIDYISDHLGIVKEEVIGIVNLLREERILADTKDLTAYINKSESIKRSLNVVSSYSKIEKFLIPLFEEKEKTLHIKELNESAEEFGCKDVTPHKLKKLLNFLSIKNWIKRTNQDYSGNHIAVFALQPKEQLMEKLEKRHVLADFIIGYLFSKYRPENGDQNKDLALVEFSVHELKDEYEKKQSFFKLDVSIEDIEDTLFYLSRIEALKIEGGFLVVYNRLTIERLEKDNKRRYKNDDYEKLNQFYESKVQQVHIVGEYAKKMISDYQKALQFVDDYFQLNYSVFLNKYFNKEQQNELSRNITPAKFKQLFGELSPSQLGIVKNKEKYAVVAAGPGSGKTRVLVHKLASLLLMEDVKHEQLLMVTFSRAAATEFKLRLYKLIGNAASFIEIKTFHSYCFDLLGKIGTIEKSTKIIKDTVEKIKNGEVEINRITKTVLVIDEAQDMDSDESQLIGALIDQNEEMRVIAVGDDDQNIYEFRGASSKYLEQFITERGADKYELIENYRSKNNLVEFTNHFASTINHRLKELPIVAKQRNNGNIKLTKHAGDNLITPLVTDIKSTDLSGTTCVLTQTNDEALQIVGQLGNSGLPAKLIQSNDGFNLFNMSEVRFFLNQLHLKPDTYIIYDDVWKNAKQKLWDNYRYSSKIDICINIVKAFESANTKKKFRSDLEIFIKESKLEDFCNVNGEKIFVSTIHKAKGKEFDNVFILLNNFSPTSDEKKRLLYVAMTRAKQNLNIHLNRNFLDEYYEVGIEHLFDNYQYATSEHLVMQLNHKEIWLDYFTHRQHEVRRLKSGDEIRIANGGCLTREGNPLLKFSKQFNEKIEDLKKSNYVLIRAFVNYILYWQKEDIETEIQIILPELHFEKQYNK